MAGSLKGLVKVSQGLNMSLVLNMPGLGIWQGCESARVLNMPE